MHCCSAQNMDISHLQPWILIEGSVCFHLVPVRSTVTVPYMGWKFNYWYEEGVCADRTA